MASSALSATAPLGAAAARPPTGGSARCRRAAARRCLNGSPSHQNSSTVAFSPLLARAPRGGTVLRRCAPVDADAADTGAAAVEASTEEVAEMVSDASASDSEELDEETVVPDGMKTVPKAAVERDFAKEAGPYRLMGYTKLF